MTLEECAIRYSSDKYYNHSYCPAYERLFSGMKPKLLLELGIGYEDLMKAFVPKYIHGASLRMWRDFFPECQIIGADIREDTLFTDNRITTYQVDQSDPRALLSLISKIGRPDIIIDDGSHQFEHQMISAITLLPYLREGGIYIIEDTYSDKGGIIARKFRGDVIFGNKRPDDCMVVIQK